MDRDARDHLQRCFLLHRRDYTNTSLLLEIFSPHHGRLAAIAKGAKRPRRGTPAHYLQPFQPLWLSWSGGGEVKTLTRSEPAAPAFVLVGTALYCGFYLNELLLRTLGRGDAHTDLFAYYHAALSDLAAGPDAHTPLRHFELRLLHELGYAAALERDTAGDAVVAERRYVYALGEGLRTAATDDAEAPSVSGRTLLALASGERLAGAAIGESRDLMRRLLAPYLGDKPLKSRELLVAQRTRSEAARDASQH